MEMKSQRQLGWFLVALLLFALGTSTLFAQDGENSGLPTNINYPPNNPGAPADAGNPANDPPSRVARIQYISGEVSLQPGGVNDWVAADLNRPLTTSDRVWTDKNSRAELNVGSAFLRMDSESSLTLTNVGNNTVQAELDQGELEVTVLHLEPGEVYEIDTPNLAFTVEKPGVYRFDVRPSDNQTFVTVRKGNGQATGNGTAVKVNSGEQVRFTGQGTLQHEAFAAPAPDGFDDWAQVRDKRLDGSQSARYVAPGTIGYQDLDYYGRWQTVPQYGAIWVPNSVPAGWAPYRYGHWVWVAPWGWTWVDDAPWGFAPFHYGRWVSYGGYWGWAPGPIAVGWRPYYAPALVGWIGGGGWGFGVSFGVGFGFGAGCGWFPLGWGEPYYPWYHGYRGGWVSNTYVRNVNITNTHITNITNVTNNYYHNNINNTHYVNRNVAGAVTAAPKSALANGQNIARVGMTVPRSELGKGEIVRGADVTPTRQAMMGGQQASTRATPPRGAFSRPVVTQNTPPVRQQASQPLEAHNVPQSPTNVGSRAPNTMSPSQNVPRPAERNATANAAPTSGYTPQSGAQHAVPKPPYAGGPIPAANSASQQHNPSGYSNQAANSAAQHNSPNYSNQHSVPQPPHDASHVQQTPASQNHSAPPAHNSNENKSKDTPKSNPGMASNVSRPQPGYGYHAAPASSGSSYANSTSAYNGGSRSYSSQSPAYSRGPGAYGSPATAYRSQGSYAAAPAYNARVYAPAPQHASAPSAPHYSGGSGGGSAHYSGGGGGNGGGGSHSSSSGGHNSGHSR
jgi:hypothetical protein